MKNSFSQKAPADGIVLLAKTPGLTSFASLNNVKKALNTKKVGHTGTLDSFAQGLLVVCTGHLTKLAGNITEFDKSYSAILKFGEETDTLEFTGTVTKTAPLPSIDSLKEALSRFTGDLLQAPPVYSAIHVDGQRASDLARKGIDVEIPKRKITVFNSILRDYKLSDDKKGVLYAQIDFTVSKGTYIRCLARDIAAECGSAAHLTGLLRTKVGNFTLCDAAGFSLLKEFTIENAIKVYEPASSEQDLFIQKEIREKMQQFSESTSLLCGFLNVHLKSENDLFAFKNGKPLKTYMFNDEIDYNKNCNLAVFFNGNFCGLVKINENKKLSYVFVIP